MAIEIVKGYPPNHDEICAVFNIRGNKNIVYTYGEKIYVPSGNPVMPDLMAHEEIHVQQQRKMGVEEWWAKYLSDTKFRLSQELEAYRVQYAIMKTHYDRSTRRMLLKKISKDLAGPIYGNLLNKREAERMITEGI